MAVNVLNAFVGHPPTDFGVLFRAPLGQIPPKHALDKLPVAAEDHGAVGEDGVTVSPDRKTADIPMFGGETFIDVQESYDESVEVTLLEDDNDAVLRSVFGARNIEKTEKTLANGTQRVIYHTSDPMPISTFYVRTAYGDKNKLYFIERGRVSSISEIKDQHKNVTSRKITIKTFKPVSVELRGGNVVEFRDDGVTIAAVQWTVSKSVDAAGTYKLDFGGQKTIALNPATATADLVATELAKLSTIGVGKVVVTGNPDRLTVRIDATKVGNLTADTATITTGTVTVA